MNARLTSNNKDMYLTIENRNDQIVIIELSVVQVELLFGR